MSDLYHSLTSIPAPCISDINREEESSGDSSSESAMDIMEEGSRHSGKLRFFRSPTPLLF